MDVKMIQLPRSQVACGSCYFWNGARYIGNNGNCVCIDGRDGQCQHISINKQNLATPKVATKPGDQQNCHYWIAV